MKQQFNPKSPNQVWASDITYIRTSKGFCYLCVVMDLFARKIISWQLSQSLNAKLVEKSIVHEWNNRDCLSLIIFHSDRGSQYTSEKIRNLLYKTVFIILNTLIVLIADFHLMKEKYFLRKKIQYNFYFSCFMCLLY
ncbi:MAG: DDE-type integrase/transposase/recombinase [Synergistaceae bacterium]|nr:DDE-type integrase/transposase/recombinase [Synergistaceae bacterium]